jgi:hypothetical protein
VIERGRIEAVFDAVSDVLPFRYAQWLVEDPQTRDYRVAAARFPEGASCYDVAHRTGVIGQVFRLRRPLLVEAARAHPLYDPYDPAVEWELTIPLFLGVNLQAVLNLEGEGRPVLSPERWEALRARVAAEAHREIPPKLPRAGDEWKLETEWFEVRQLPGRAGRVSSLAGAAARSGAWTLWVGSPSSDRCRVAPLAERIRGYSERLDVLVPPETPPGAQELEELQKLVEGRYQLVIVAGRAQ